MLHDKQLITVETSLWQAIGDRAGRAGMTTEEWLRRQLHAVSVEDHQPLADDADEILLDLVVRHFRELRLDRDEQQWLADAMMATIDSGEPARVGPVGARGRHYRIHRRASAVEIRVGEGRVSLPLPQAMRLVVLLSGTDTLQLETVIAA